MVMSTKLLRLPDRGRLLVSADLHGNLRDFLAIVAHFESLGSDGYLLFLGDVLHGPYVPFDSWGAHPLLRGRPYRDQSPALLLGISELMARYPGRVFILLGNHEHAHIGGPRTSVFARDEAAVLEQRIGIEGSSWLAQLLDGLPIWAVTASGLLFSHAAPAALLGDLAELEGIDYRHYSPPQAAALAPQSGAVSRPDPASLLGSLLWTSSLPPVQARQVLDTLGLAISIYGHSVIPAGYQTIGSEQLILSSSFGTEDAYKKILCLDLAVHYRSVSALRLGHEVVPLYPIPSAPAAVDIGRKTPRFQATRPARSTILRAPP